MDVQQAARDVLMRNRRSTDGHHYTVPSPDTYPYQWLWDSCFHVISSCTHDHEFAKAELRALMSKQLSDGMVPHIIYWEPQELHKYQWGREGVSALTQPPMVAYAVWEVYRKTSDITFLEELYPAVLNYYRYLLSKRDPRDRHLVGIINPDESGEDNSPRFDAVLNVPDDISYDDHLARRMELIDANRTCNFDAEMCMREHFWVKDVPFNAILHKNLQILSHMASALKKDEDERFALLHADLVKEAMRRWMFDDGVYWSTYGRDYHPLKVVTWAHVAPMFAGLYSPEEAENVVVNYLRNPGVLRGEHGLRTVSRQEPSYRADGFWRGPTWMAVHWFVYHGLLSYGYKDDAAEILNHSKGLLEQSGFREYFNPETGEGYGADNFTWGALILDMIEHHE